MASPKQGQPKASRRGIGGRPPKFSEPRRPITVTLPERTLRQLESVSSDRARAIVRVTDLCVEGAPIPGRGVEILPVAPGLGIILTGPCPPLLRIPHLRTIEIAPDRFLLTVVPGTPIEAIEVGLADLIGNFQGSEDSERAMAEDLLRILQARRRDKTIWKAEILFVEPRL